MADRQAALYPPSAGAGARRRRRRWPYVTGVLLAIVLVLLVIADRVGARVAENAAETRLADYAEFGQRPTVHVRGFPFLTQAVTGRYRDIEVVGDDVRIGSATGAHLDVDLHGMHLSLGDLRSNNVSRLPVDRVDGTVTLPLRELARLSGVSGLSLSYQGGRLRVSATLPVAAAGGSVPVSGVGELTLHAGSVRLHATQVSIAGVDLPPSVLAQLAGALSADIAIPSLPYGLRLESVSTTADGLVLQGTASDVVLHARD